MAVSGIGILNTLAIAAGVEITRAVRFAEGPRGLLDIYAPRGAMGAPVVVFFYGGGWEAGDRADYRFVAVTLARRGCVVAVPDYRIYPRGLYPDFLVDGAKAVRSMRRNAEEFGGDPSMVFLAGHSAGAYIAVMLGLDKRWLDGPSLASLKGIVGIAGPYDFLPFHSNTVAAIFRPADSDAETQPITHARGDAAPLLLMTPARDGIVRPENSYNLATRITEAGGRVDVLTYPRANHLSIVGAFSPLLRPAAPVLADTARFVMMRSGLLRPKSGSNPISRTTPLT